MPTINTLDANQVIEAVYDLASSSLKVDVVASTGLPPGHADGTAHTPGDVGSEMLAVRNDAGTPLAADGQYIPLTTDASGNLRVAASFTEGATAPDGGALPAVVKVAGGYDGTNVQVIKTDAAGELQIDVLSSALPTGAATAANQATGNASLASIDTDIDVALSSRASEATLSALNAKITDFDLDTGAGTQNVTGVSLRKAASGGSVELGTSSDPIRVDPTGTTAQPITDNGGSLTVDGAVTVSATDLDIRDLSAAQDSVRLGDGTDLANVTGAGELNVLATAQPGVDIGDVTINNAAGVAAVNIQDGGNSITVDGTVAATQSGTWTVQPGNTANTTPWLATINQGGNSASVSASNALKVDGSAVTQPISGTVTANIGTTGGLALNATLTDASQKTQIVDGSGNVIGSTSNALDVNIKSGITLEVNLDNANDDVLVYGWDGAANQKIKTDVAGELQVDVLSSALPTGAATSANQATEIASLASIDGKLHSYDLDTGAGTENAQGVNLRFSASGGSVEAGRAANPLRTDPTGTTAQPVTDNGGSLTVDGTVTVTATDLDIRDLSHTQDSVRIGDGTDLALVTAAGELNVIATAQPGVDIGDVTINNAAGAAAVNIQDGGNSITVDGTVAATQSGTWTVQPGNTANTTPWLATINQGGNSAAVTGANALKVDGSAVTQPISGTISSTDIGYTNSQFVRNDYTSVNVTTAAYVQLIASVAQDYQEFEIFDSSGQTLKIAFGAAASEVDQFLVFPGGNGRIKKKVTSGTRISIRAVSGTANAGEISLNLYG